MYIGIDLGTSGVKVVLMNEQQQIIATETEALTVSRPHPLWSEQDPDAWWQATCLAMEKLSQAHNLSDVKAIGLSGQMHGATLLDKQQKILRPAILWNDGRSQQQCAELETEVTNSRQITGNLMMPGFTAPKLRWLAENEPALFEKIDKVLLPKDYLRWCLTGEFASDMSDAAGTMWLDTQKRQWSDVLLKACYLSIEQMPTLFEGNQITGYLTKTLADSWNMPCVPVVAGGGDNAAGAIGVGIYKQGQAMLSLGTSGVYFAVSAGFLSNPESAVHSFCHALPKTWHLMSVMLSAASCLDWSCRLTGLSSVSELFNEVEAADIEQNELLFLPYLSGERTPYNNPYAKGCFGGLTHSHGRAHLNKAVIEGISLGLSQCMDVLHHTGLHPTEITLIGGGARSGYWRQLLADITGEILLYRVGGDVGPALGAARLAQLAMHPNVAISDICTPLPIEKVYTPERSKTAWYQEQKARFAELYQQTYPLTEPK